MADGDADVDGDGVGEPPTASRVRTIAPGAALAVAVAIVATLLGESAPLLGAPVIGIVLGVALRAALGRRDVLVPGLSFSATQVLQLGVVLVGAQLSLHQVAEIGIQSLPVMLVTLTTCLLLAYLFGRAAGIDRDLTTLIGVGTAICGASAIAAVTPVIRARTAAVSYAVSTIFLFNIAAVLTFPAVGHLLGLSQSQFGLFAGTAVNDTSSVIAAASSYGTAAGEQAVVVKLARTLMIIPITLILAALENRRERRAAEAAGTSEPDERSLPARIVALVPWFLVGFIVVASVNSMGLIPAASHAGLKTTSLLFVTVALAAIGLSTDTAQLRRTGPRPLLLGMLLWLAVSSTSLLSQAVIGA